MLLYLGHSKCVYSAALSLSRLTCEVQDLVEVARKKFNLGNVDLGFHSSCANLCGDFAVKIDKDAWEQVAPYIGCLIITSSNHANEVCHVT